MIRLPYLPLELVAAHILLRLPVETLLRFRCVCKAWRDAVDDASFRRAHLRRQKPCLLISPQIVKTLPGEVTTGGLYLWLWGESQKEEATLVHAMSGPSFLPRAAAGPWEVAAHDLAHCDGLVLVPAYSAVHLLNPATRRAVTLPPSLHRPHVVGRPRAIGHQALGLGLDPRSNAYKVARFSYRSSDKPSGHGRYTIGMEVLTVRIPHYWRETSTPPPYPVMPGRTATFFKGSLFWTIDESLFQDATTVAPGFMRFRLDDESFGVTPPPPCRRRIDYQAITLSELSGELCLCVPQEFVPDQVDESYELWVCHGMDDDEQGQGPRWERRHVIVGYPVFPGFRGLRPVAADADSILLYGGTSCHLCRCHRQTQETISRFYADVHHLSYHHPDSGTLVDYKNNVCDFNITAYTPSLLPL
ncbi:F-box/LRR-repeat protein At2g43260-like [Triticum urartu]|nr:F-box/LRR-repeat protein At2g43260-like [Triticum urartu]